MAPQTFLQLKQETDGVAPGRGCGAGRYADLAPVLLENGYEPIPIRPGMKIPALTRWSSCVIDAEAVQAWCETCTDHGVGLRTGHLVGIDIDVLDPDIAHQLQDLADRRLGAFLLRVGQWPKRLLLYRTAVPIPKRTIGRLEILGLGQQFVAFGRHPGTGSAYDWPLGETPLDVPREALAEVTSDDLDTFLGEAAGMLPRTPGRRRSVSVSAGASAGAGPVRDEAGLVIDGRDSWLSSIAFHAVHDAIGAGGPLIAEAMAHDVWNRFAATALLDRARQDGSRSYGWLDALRKVRDKLRLHAEERLPARSAEDVLPDYELPVYGVEDARMALDVNLGDVCEQILEWHENRGDAPQIGIRATVGLGKTTLARRHLLGLRDTLREKGLPDRLLVLTPSHALAEETAALWRQEGVAAAVLRGYHKRDPVTGAPMCRDTEAVDAAVRCGATVQDTICASGERRCRHFEACLKQKNRREVAAADVVVAPYDVLFTGVAMPTDQLALILIDEGFWSRALTCRTLGSLKSFGEVDVEDLPPRHKPSSVASLADLASLRARAAQALHSNGPGILTLDVLAEAKLTSEDCRLAAALEDRGALPRGLDPGMSDADRRRAIAVSHQVENTRLRKNLWYALAEMIEGSTTTGRVRLCRSKRDAHDLEIRILGRRSIHPNLVDLPVVNLDATLRPELVRPFLPRLSAISIDAAAPHMALHHIVGKFGKTALTPSGQAEQRSILGVCVDHVRWHARRVSPGRVLVVTYKACEPAFKGIPGVETAHFNAIAGIDAYKDAALLIVIGRPLPSETDVATQVSSLFGVTLDAGYRFDRRGVHMAGGATQEQRCQVHCTPKGELIRAAICDDEVLQAVGRGRGINRTTRNPLEVHVLADVVLPLAYKSVRAWETGAPDLLQRMLLAGGAVTSPGDAALMHPGMFGSAEQAKTQFERTGFKGQMPYKGSYKGMSLKYARYRRAGRGRSWQHVWWLDGDAETMLETLTYTLGLIDGWEPQ